jgi:hypothetical protein
MAQMTSTNETEHHNVDTEAIQENEKEKKEKLAIERT